MPWQGYREENPALGGNSVRSFLIDLDHIIDPHQSKELNTAHQMKYAELKTCVIKEIQSKTLKQISQIVAGH